MKAVQARLDQFVRNYQLLCVVFELFYAFNCVLLVNHWALFCKHMDPGGLSIKGPPGTDLMDDEFRWVPMMRTQVPMGSDDGNSGSDGFR